MHVFAVAGPDLFSPLRYCFKHFSSFSFASCNVSSTAFDGSVVRCRLYSLLGEARRTACHWGHD